MSNDDRLTIEERKILLEQARKSIESSVRGEPSEMVQLEDFPDKLRQPGVTFVTLTIDQKLRGCVGALEAYQPLVSDVQEHALAAATKDYRFSPVRLDELSKIKIEISRLTTPQPLDYNNPDDLLEKIRPGIDGVVLKDGLSRATFLPQVWKKLSSPATFLDHLCQKMGYAAGRWREKKMGVFIYQVEEFHE